MLALWSYSEREQTDNPSAESIMSQTKPHFAHLDLIKGIAIFLVVCGHIFVFGSNFEGGQGRFVLWNLLVAVHMPLFMMVSGYLAANTKASLAALPQFIRGKSLRLLLPLLSLPSLYYISFRLNVVEVLGAADKGGYWFTFCLFEIFLLFFAFKGVNILLNKSQRIAIEIAIAFLFITSIALIEGQLAPVKGGFFQRLLSFEQVNWLFKYFLLGYFVRRIPRLEEMLRNDKVITGLAFSFVILMMLPYQGIGLPKSLLVYHGLIGIDLEALQTLTGCLAIYALCLRASDLGISNKTTKLIRYLGRESLPIYLTHYFFLPVLPMMMPFIHGLPNSARAFSWELFFAFAASAWVIGLSLGVIRVVKLSPTLAMLLYGEPIKKTRA